MLQSMTGFGRATGTVLNKKITVELRSLNSKGVDIYLKTPNSYRAYELPIRKALSNLLKRGKIECIITEEPLDGKEAVFINSNLVLQYHEKMKEIAHQLGESTSNLLPIIMQMPEIFHSDEQDMTEAEWGQVETVLNEAITQMIQSRKTEGKTIKNDFENSVDTIEQLLQRVSGYEEQRIELVKERLYKGLEKLGENADENRFEQELIFYIEKLDINEEKTRLQHHINFFRATLNSSEAIGKKLGFIAQEMGREINTLGSKSYHADLQKIVVEMKDNLEQIKEQVANAL